MEVTTDPLAIERYRRWASSRECGATVVFAGSTRADVVEGSVVEYLRYQCYEEYVLDVIAGCVGRVEDEFPELSKIVVAHRVGRVDVTEESICVVTASPHRETAFSSNKNLVRLVKERAPIWKQEVTSDATTWKSCNHLQQAH